MEATPLVVFGAAALTSSAAIFATVFDRFRTLSATGCALAAGIFPWLSIGILQSWLPSSTPLTSLSFVGSAPFFLFAFILYGVGKRTETRRSAAAASLIGMFLGAVFSCSLMAGLAQIG
jgi:hypothetical protein